MHSEIYEVPEATRALIAEAHASGRSAVGGHHQHARAGIRRAWRRTGGRLRRNRHLHHPGYRFRVVDRLLTNFHLPKSTLLMLVSAFAGYEEMRAAYQHAVEREYRFFSYGDSMLLERKD